MVISDLPFERPLLRPQVKFVGNIIGNSGPTCYILLKLIYVSHYFVKVLEDSDYVRKVPNNNIILYVHPKVYKCIHTLAINLNI